MTPKERQLVEDLFDRLGRLETAPRDAEAERVIAEGLVRAPHSVYPLVQTVLVQDEALRRADARIRELSGEHADDAAGGGFLDSMRQALTGHSTATSVPSVRASAPDPRWNSGGAPGSWAAPAQGGAFGGGSFLGTAAASAAGVIGGALLLNSISAIFGHHGASAFAAAPPGGSPWDNSASGSDLAREAGLNDIGNSQHADAGPVSLFDADDPTDTADLVDDSDLGGDFGGGIDS
ncbi:MAG TPA: DUF2076 domain-containing protein [Pseudolabrys sp.]|nr:DUF2076 domain-containing protein [Pseudolabrys sp.]